MNRRFLLVLSLFLSLLCAQACGGNPSDELLPSGTGDPQMPAALPDSTTVSVGRTDGEFSVSPTGAATYRIPIQVPPGRRGMQPELAIVYDSHHKDGQLGVGVKLSGVGSTIHRCPKNPSRDGQLKTVAWDRFDALCLDGEGLILKSGRYLTDLAEYRRERDEIEKIVQYGTPPTHFLVHTKGGRILRYGTDKSCTACRSVMDGKGVPRAWALEEIADRFGNTIRIQYHRRQNVLDPSSPAETMEFYPETIFYTGKHGAGASRRITFDWSGRNDRTLGWHDGIRSESTVRLSKIRTSVDDQLTREYRLTYAYGRTSKRSIVTKVEECAGDGVCKPPTQFRWRDGSTSYSKRSTGVAAPTMALDPVAGGSTSIPILTGDFNADGKTDLFYPNGMTTTASGTWRRVMAGADGLVGASETNTGHVSAWPHQAVAINYDNDATTDVLLLENRSTWRVLKSGQQLVDTGISNRVGTLQTASTFHGRHKLADFTGDGLHDLVSCVPRVSSPGTFRWHYRLNTGTGFGTERELPFTFSPDCRDDLVLIMDADGDGATDLLLGSVGPAGLDAVRFTGSAPARSSTALPVTLGGIESPRVRTMDLNGDGLTDLLSVASGQGGGRIRHWINQGGRFLGGSNGIGGTLPDDFGQYADSLSTSVVMDHNGDGQEDLFIDGHTTGMVGCIPGGTPGSTPPCPPLRSWNWEVLVNNGSSDLVPLDTGLSYDDNNRGSGYARSRAIDDNGDLLPDVVMVEGDVFKVLRHGGSKPDLVTHIRDGMVGAAETVGWASAYSVGITYRPSTDSAIYAGTASVGEAVGSCNYPVRCGNPMMMLVGTHFVDNGTSTDRTNDFDHVYLDARRDRLGRGFLGFRQHKVEEPHNGNSFTLLSYDNFTYDPTNKRYPLQRHLLKRQRRLAGIPVHGGRQESFTTYSYDFVNQGKSFFSYLASEETRVHELGSGPEESSVDSNRTKWLKRTTTVDEFNNPKVTSQYVDGVLYEAIANNLITNQTSNWLIGLVRSTSHNSHAEGTVVSRLEERTYDLVTGALATVSNDEGLDTSYGYDTYGNLTSTTQTAEGETRTTTISYDSERVFPYATTNALGHVTRQSFDRGRGVLLTSLDPNLHATRYSYDGFGRVRKEVRPDGTETRITYVRKADPGSRFHLEMGVLTPGGSRETREYDRLGRVIRTDSPGFLGAVVRSEVTYNDLGHVTSRSAPYHVGVEQPSVETYVHDRAGRLRLTKRATGKTVQVNYGKYLITPGLWVVTKDELNHWNTQRINSLGQVVYSAFDTDALGGNPAQGSMAFTYGAFGAPRTVRNAAGHITTTQTDKYNRITSLSDPNFVTRTYGYDAFGQLRRETSDVQTTFAYDKLGRIKSRSSGQGASWTYDTAPNGIGKPATATSTGAAESYSYDTFGRPNQTQLDIDGRHITDSVTYDTLGRIASSTLAVRTDAALETSLSLTYGRDPNGRLLSVSNSGDGTAYWNADRINAREQLEVETFGNGLTTTYGYDSTRHLLTSLQTPGLQNWRFEYDDKGNLFRRVDHLQNRYQWFTHDDLDRLTHVTQCSPGTLFPCAHPQNPSHATQTLVRHYTYDHIGNMTSDLLGGAHKYDPAKPQQLTQTSYGTYAYDARGNVTKRPGPAGDMTVVYLQGLSLPSMIVENGSITTKLTYTADLKRVKKATKDGHSLYAAGRYEREESAAGEVAHRFQVRAAGRVVAIITRRGSVDEVRYLHPDHLGSGEVLSNESGASEQRFRYDPYGLAQTGTWLGPVAPPPQPAATSGFTGHRHDSELDLIDMGGRIYDPKVGRFLSADPVVQSPHDTRSHNRYSYVWNNPMLNVDPSGFEAETVTMSPEPGSDEEDTCTIDGVCEEVAEVATPCDSDQACDEGSDTADVLPEHDSGRAQQADQPLPSALWPYPPDCCMKIGVLDPYEALNEVPDSGVGTVAGVMITNYGCCHHEPTTRDFRALVGSISPPGGGGAGKFSFKPSSLNMASKGGAKGPSFTPQSLGTPQKGSRPPNLTPVGAGRQGAFNEAKRRNGIPASQQADRVLPNVDKRNNPQPGVIYEFDVPAPGGGTRTIRIRDDAGGHDHGPGDPQNRGPHFNDPAGNHYDY